mgnify:FL=1
MEKQINVILIFNWKTEDLKIIKRKQYNSDNPFELPIRLKLNFIIPEKKEVQITGDIIIPEIKGAEMMIEALK